MLKQVDWVISGVSKADVASRIDHGYASHQFPQPAPGAVSFMLSHEQHLADDNPHWMPHLMFFYDKSLPPAQLGAGDFKSAMINGSAGDSHAPVLTIFVPVREWSDGATAMHDTTQQK
jgi:hypothetical protein